MANATTNNPTGRGGMNVGEYLQGVQEELKKAKWPTGPELLRLTQVVLFVIFVVAVFCGGLDLVLGWLSQKVLGLGGPLL